MKRYLTKVLRFSEQSKFSKRMMRTFLYWVVWININQVVCRVKNPFFHCKTMSYDCGGAPYLL